MAHKIIWRPSARADLLALYNWIAEQAGTEIAFSYTSRIEALTRKLASFPERGNPRDDLHPGVRTIGYRRRTVIAYRMVGGEVEILHVAHGGRDLGGVFDEAD